jgi:hypothetical protein
MSQLKTDEDSLDWRRKRERQEGVNEATLRDGGRWCQLEPLQKERPIGLQRGLQKGSHHCSLSQAHQREGAGLSCSTTRRAQPVSQNQHLGFEALTAARDWERDVCDMSALVRSGSL